MSNKVTISSAISGDFDLSSSVAIYNIANASGFDRMISLTIQVGDGTKNLNAASGTTLTFITAVDGVSGSAVDRVVAGGNRFQETTLAVPVPAGSLLTLYCASDDVADTAVGCIVYEVDEAPLAPLVAGRQPAIDEAGKVTTANPAVVNGFAGARIVTITAQDETTAVVPYALLTVSLGGQHETQQADANGQAVFSLDDDRAWKIAATRPGYSHTPETFTVDSDESITIVLTKHASVVPASPIVRGLYTVRDRVTKQPVSGATVTATLVQSASAAGQASVGGSVAAVSDESGVCTFYVLPGEMYQITDPFGEKQTVRVASDAVDPYSLMSVVVPG